jgi:DNA repair protein RadC
MLNARHRIMALHVAHVGTLNSCPVGMREIFRPAIAAGAHAIIVAHHHPSGDHTPSPEDRRVTERINKAGELLGISCLDHLVIGGTRFFSFADGITRDLPRVQRPQDRP